MQTIFVTGAASEAGRRLVEKLGVDHRVLALVHRRPLSLTGKTIVSVSGEIGCPASYAAAAAEADLIVHLAGLTHSDCPDAYERVNHGGTAALLSVCRKDQRLVYVSSRCVGESGGAYGRSKARAEEAVMSHGLRYTILRPSEIYGSREGEGIDALIRFALAYRVVVDFRWRGPVTYSPIGVDEFSALLERIVRREVREKAIYTVCNLSVYSAADIRAALTDFLQRRLWLLPLPVRALMALQLLRVPLPAARDQLARLVMPKSDDCRPVCADYGFAPRDFRAFLASRGIEVGDRAAA